MSKWTEFVVDRFVRVYAEIVMGRFYHSLVLYYIHHILWVMTGTHLNFAMYLTRIGTWLRLVTGVPYSTPFSIYVRMHIRIAGGLKVSFFPRTIATWNGLTTESVSEETIDGFKGRVIYYHVCGAGGGACTLRV